MTLRDFWNQSEVWITIRLLQIQLYLKALSTRLLYENMKESAGTKKTLMIYK